jgi:hypothetical protein
MVAVAAFATMLEERRGWFGSMGARAHGLGELV